MSIYSGISQTNTLVVVKTLAANTRCGLVRERWVITLRYGLSDGKTMTYEQIGNVCGVSRERVRQIKNKAMKLLKKKAIEFSTLAE